MRTKKVHKNIKLVRKEIETYKIKNRKQLTKRLSSFGLYKVPIMEFKKHYGNKIKPYEERIEKLKGKEESYYLFITGLVLGTALGSMIVTPWTLLAFILPIIGLIYQIILVRREIRKERFLLEEWEPYIIIQK